MIPFYWDIEERPDFGIEDIPAEYLKEHLENIDAVIQDLRDLLRVEYDEKEKERRKVHRITKEQAQENDMELFIPPKYCIPIKKDVRMVDWEGLAQLGPFDAILMDPPWNIAGRTNHRGVTLNYDTLPDQDIMGMNINALVQDATRPSFIFIWTVNAKIVMSLEVMEMWGFEYFDLITWVKETETGSIFKANGYYLQHSKEHCLVGIRYPENGSRRLKDYGIDPSRINSLISAPRKLQSKKPDEIYNIIEQLIPGGKYIEIFARRHNLRDFWVSIGMEI